MKTFTQLADSLKVSRQTLYNLIDEDNELDIDNLTAARQGKARLFNDETETLLRQKLLSRQKEQGKKNVVKKDNRQQSDIVKKLEEQVRQLTTELEQEKQKHAADVEEVKRENTLLLQTSAAQALTIQQMTTANLAKLADGGEKKPGWISRAAAWIGTEIREIKKIKSGGGTAK